MDAWRGGGGGKGVGWVHGRKRLQLSWRKLYRKALRLYCMYLEGGGSYILEWILWILLVLSFDRISRHSNSIILFFFPQKIFCPPFHSTFLIKPYKLNLVTQNFLHKSTPVWMTRGGKGGIYINISSRESACVRGCVRERSRENARAFYLRDDVEVFPLSISWEIGAIHVCHRPFRGAQVVQKLYFWLFLRSS